MAYTLFSRHSNDTLTDVTDEIHLCTEYTVGRDSSAGISTRYELDCRGVESRWEAIFSVLTL
jgi:hypothetical protein